MNSKRLRKQKLNSTDNNHYYESERLYIRPIKLTDVTNEYIKWLNSKQINKFLESRFVKHNQKTLRNYVRKILKDKNLYFFAIFQKDDGKHIGNIKLGPIDWHHKFGEIGIIIGDKAYWGQGYATEAIKLITNFAFKKLKLHKLTAGAYENNLGSIKAFTKAGFKREGYRKNHFLFNQKYIGNILLAKINE